MSTHEHMYLDSVEKREVFEKAREALSQHPELSMREVAEQVIIPGLKIESSRVKHALLDYADELDEMRLARRKRENERGQGHYHEKVNASENSEI